MVRAKSAEMSFAVMVMESFWESFGGFGVEQIDAQWTEQPRQDT
jgi:hypothetical protein